MKSETHDPKFDTSEWKTFFTEMTEANNYLSEITDLIEAERGRHRQAAKDKYEAATGRKWNDHFKF